MEQAGWDYSHIGPEVDFMLDKIEDIQTGLLRFKDKKGRVALKVKGVKASCPTSMQLFLSDDNYNEKLVNYPASFTQKDSSGYLYVTGYLSAVTLNNAYLLTMKINKAHLFRSRGSGVNKWLEEVCMFDPADTQNN